MENVSVFRNCNGLNFVGNLFESRGNIKSLVNIKEDFHLLESKKFQRMQSINAYVQAGKSQ